VDFYDEEMSEAEYCLLSLLSKTGYRIQRVFIYFLAECVVVWVCVCCALAPCVASL